MEIMDVASVGHHASVFGYIMAGYHYQNVTSTKLSDSNMLQPSDSNMLQLSDSNLMQLSEFR